MAHLPADPMIAAWVALFRASDGLVSAVQAEVRAAGCPPLEWYDVLWDLEQAPEFGRRPFELKNRLLLAQYNLSRLVERLVKAGLVERRPCTHDGRGHVLLLTEAGKALRRQTWPIYQAAILRHVGAHLTLAEAKTLSELLARLIDGLRTEPAPAACGEPPSCGESTSDPGGSDEL